MEAMQVISFLSIGAGGFVGAVSRYLLSDWVNNTLAHATGNTTWPFGTLFVNFVGSFALAVFGVWALEQANLSENTRLLIATGFFGALTTFSTYANESIALIRAGDYAGGVSNIAISNGLCLVGVVGGLWFVNRVMV